MIACFRIPSDRGARAGTIGSVDYDVSSVVYQSIATHVFCNRLTITALAFKIPLRIRGGVMAPVTGRRVYD
jgi:hypothetical protein